MANGTSAAVEDLQWLSGSWIDGPHAEHWHFAGGALFGVGFRVDDERTSLFDVMLVEQPDGSHGDDTRVRLVAMPNGGTEVVFPLVEHGSDGSRRWATFENEAHDDPVRIRYERSANAEGDLLRAELTNREGAVMALTWRLDRNPLCLASDAGTAELQGGSTSDVARAVMAADVAFDRMTLAKGVEGWVSYFLADGAMWDRRARLHRRGEAIRAAMAPLFESGRRLRWTPHLVCHSSAGDTAFSIGTSQVESPPDANGDRTVERTGAYVTVWQRSPGTHDVWRVRFDTGI